MYNLYCRLYQLIYRLVMYLLPWREPKLLQGAHTLSQLPQLLKQQKGRILIVTDQTIVQLDFMKTLYEVLSAHQLNYILFDKVIPNPTIDNIEEGRQCYIKNGCTAIVAIGGGSVIDCAKGIGARIAKPAKTIPQLKGQLKVRAKLLMLIAIPTTAGTGSEATVAAVISNSQTLEKYAINDLALIPYAAILDPTLTLKLPPAITATTGMDALTHAVEAYISHSHTTQTRAYCLEAVTLIFENLEKVYHNGSNLEARANMQLASYKAGLAFTRAYVGNIHAIAHTLGGHYQIAHGLANAVIMPYVLRFYGTSIYKPLAELAQAAGIGAKHMSMEQRAIAFIEAIEQLNTRMNIPRTLEGIKDEDIATLVSRALKEANPLYPVPVIMNESDMTKLYKSLQQEQTISA